MEGAFSNGMCRCCASEGMEGTFKNVSSKYHWMGEEEIYADMLRECFDITLASASNKCQEGGICEVCITQLRNASNFKKQVLHTEILFKKKLQNYMFKTNIVKVEVSPLDDAGNASDNNLSDDLSGPEYDVAIKTEAEEPKTKKRGKATPTSKAKKPKVEDAETSTKSTRNTKLEMRKGRTIRLPPALKKECNKKYELSELEKHRANIRTILQCSNATPIRRHGGIGYICSFCTEQYQDPADLKAHTLQIHDKNVMEFMDGAKVKSRMGELIIKLDITSLQCKLCDSNFDMLHELVNHLVEDHDKKIYAVDKDHIFPLKFNGSILRCVICCNVFRKFKGLLEHMSTHYRNFICDVCDKGFVNRCMLMNHVGVHKIGVFHCTFCDKVFETAKRQRYHERSVHTYMSFSRQCSYCDLKFKDNTQRENHMRQFHGAVIEIKCQACDKTLRNQAAFNIHMKRDHLMERPHKCAECDMEFFRSDDLKDHMVKHSGEKLFQCAICLKSYGQRRTLMGHLRIHANDRRFKCEHCGVSFIQKCSLKTHMRSKHGE